jgi:hypothetical protein
MNTTNAREPLKWTEDAIFSDAQSTLAVRVSKAQSGDRLMFSIELGRLNADRQFIRFFNPRIESKGTYQVSVSFFNVLAFTDLVRQAEEHCKTTIEDDRLEKKRQREVADLDRGKPKMRPGLKQLGKLDRAGKP